MLWILRCGLLLCVGLLWVPANSKAQAPAELVRQHRYVDALEALSEEAKAISHPPVESGAEDVHTWVEQKLVEKLGSLGKKLHTGRSRNDQVATDFRLWTRDAVGEIRRVTVAVARALAEKAEAHHGDAFQARASQLRHV